MIIPIYFRDDSYFDSDKLKQHFNDIADDRSAGGPNQDRLHNAVSQIYHHMSPTDWNLQQHCVDFEDVLSGAYDKDSYLEITTGHWYLLKDRSWVQGKNIIICNYTESWLRGIPFPIEFGAYEEDISVIEDAKLAKHAIIVRDNATRLDDVQCVPIHPFYMETNDCHRDWIDVEDVDTFVEKNINLIGKKQKQFTALLGMRKPHRDDFYNKIAQTELDGYIGGFGYNEIEHNIDHDFPLKDRYIAKEWLINSNLWVSHETHWVTVGLKQRYKCSPVTEKIWKPIAFGMPFVLNASTDNLNRITELGFNNFTEVFGNYHTEDYESTNDNIIDIIKNFETFDLERIKSICTQNRQRFVEFGQAEYKEFFFKELGISYS